MHSSQNDFYQDKNQNEQENPDSTFSVISVVPRYNSPVSKYIYI